MRLSRIWKPVLFVAIAILAIALFGRSVLTRSSNANSIPQLVFVSPSDPATFNTPLNQSAFNIFGFINEGLLTQNGITTELEPALAESWKISEDKLKIVFTLREGLQWSDGHPLTADDVEFSYNDIYLNEKVPTGIRDILRVGDGYPSVRKIDDLHVEFTVPEPFAPFLRYAGGISILPKHALQKAVETTDEKGDLVLLTTWGTDTDPKEIVGAGYYRMTDYIPGQRVIFERNPYYWRKDETGESQPYVERIILQIIESDETQSIAFRSGELDSLDVKPESFSLLKKEEKKGKYTIYNGGPSAESRFVGFNLSKAKNEKGVPFVDPIKSKWFNDVRFRQAIAYAVNRDRMKNNIYRGLGAVQHSPIGVSSPYYLSPEEGLKTYDYNPQKAKDLFREMGFEYKDDGQLFDADNHPIRFNLLVKSEEKTRVDAAVQIQQDLKAIGIQADLQVLNFNTVLKHLRGRDWDAYVGGFGGGGVEPHSSFNIWYSGGSLHQFNQGPYPWEKSLQGWEVSDWEKEIDRLFQEGARELDESKRREIYGDFQKVVAENVPFLYLVNALSLEAVRDRIENIKFTSFGGAFWNLYELKVEED